MNYWNKLSEREKNFMQKNAFDYGIRYCKRILSLARSIDGWDDDGWDEICNASIYAEREIDKIIFKNLWIVYKDGIHVGFIQKTENIGINERIHSWCGKEIKECWNNLCSKNPPKNVLRKITVYFTKEEIESALARKYLNSIHLESLYKMSGK